MKICNTQSKEIDNYFKEMFNVQTSHCAMTKRKCKFLYKYNVIEEYTVQTLSRVRRKGIGIVCVFV